MWKSQWLTTATWGVRFGPDRKAVRAELEAHLEDKEADLLRLYPDLSPREAETRVLREMGDPIELFLRSYVLTIRKDDAANIQLDEASVEEVRRK